MNNLDLNRIPEHIAIIMDGNGRWALEQGKPRSFGHQAGVDAVRRITSECTRLGVKFLTLYTFSTENWNRPVDEIASLIEYTKRVGGIDYARETMENFRKEAMPLIATFTNEQVREALTDYLDYTIGRSL